ncbi:hypothetical protein TNCV_4021451 [Trichonephila clavipes]|nr:hypothetical protein TNCV_4021451 [Trichonephila clavipes]
MATNTSQDVDRSGLGHIAIRTRRVNFKTRHMPLSSSMSTANPIKNRFILHTACPKAKQHHDGTLPTTHVWGPRGSDILFVIRVEISEKVRQPPCVPTL